MRLEPRVGDRPAGAVRGDETAMLVFSRAAGDLGCKWARARGAVDVAVGAILGGALLMRCVVDAALVSTNADGLKKSPIAKLVSAPAPSPFVRLEKSDGSTFSKSSASRTSDAFRLIDGVFEMAADG
jgi:hypothetical protein